MEYRDKVAMGLLLVTIGLDDRHIEMIEGFIDDMESVLSAAPEERPTILAGLDHNAQMFIALWMMAHESRLSDGDNILPFVSAAKAFAKIEARISEVQHG